MLRYYPNESMNFFFKNFYQKVLKTLLKATNEKHEMIVNSVGGTLGGITTRILLYPFDYTRTKMANDVNGKEGGILSNLFKTFKAEGLFGIYRGALISFYGISIFRGTYFGIYDSYKGSKYHEIEKWFLSYFSYVTATFLTYPTDTVRRRLMMTSCANYKYKGFTDCLSRIIKQEGFLSLFRGGNIIFLQACSGSTIYYIFDKIFTNMSSRH